MKTPQARFVVLITYEGDEDIYRALQAGRRPSVSTEGHHDRGDDYNDLDCSCWKLAYSGTDCAEAGCPFDGFRSNR